MDHLTVDVKDHLGEGKLLIERVRRTRAVLLKPSIIELCQPRHPRVVPSLHELERIFGITRPSDSLERVGSVGEMMVGARR